jgi:hypothetical protein
MHGLTSVSCLKTAKKKSAIYSDLAEKHIGFVLISIREPFFRISSMDPHNKIMHATLKKAEDMHACVE